MIFENFFNELEPEECVSILSSVICQENTEFTPVLNENLEKFKNKISKLAYELG